MKRKIIIISKDDETKIIEDYKNKDLKQKTF